MRGQYDVLFENATIIDGTGATRRQGAVAIRGGKIVAVGEVTREPAAASFDLRGKVIAPGFIDAHSHSDLTLISNPAAQSKVRQGVTTEIVGNCGFSPAPITDLNRTEMVTGNAYLGGGAELDWSWSSMGGYMDRMDRQGIALNVLPLAGHGPIRSAGMGFERRAPTSGEMETMRALLREALLDGVLGMSSGLIFPPGSYADTEEMVELARVLAEHGGIYFSHIRGEDVRLLRAVAEAIEIGERAGVPVQIAHHKAFGTPNWGRVRDALEMIERARERGIDVSVDVYPYTAGMGLLTQTVPEWAQAGGADALLGRLRDARARSQIEQAMSTGGWEWEHSIIAWVASGGADEIGRSVAAIAAERRTSPQAVAIDLIVRESAQAAMVHYGMDENDVRYVLKHPAAMIGSDGIAISPEQPLGTGMPHPRFYGAFPRVLGHYAREVGLFTLEEAVHKMTGMTAAKLGLRAKGVIEPGADADLVVFSELEVVDRATFEAPQQFPAGISEVMVNGRFVVRDGTQTDELPGKVLRRPEHIYEPKGTPGEST